ncbi:MAG: hypothetical protein NDI77_12650 [Geobacteraceae bacterium]|nr:hypothetical protein [Geobacteraceae bacterium]
MPVSAWPRAGSGRPIRIAERGVVLMADESKTHNKGQDGVTLLISFLAGAAVGVGLVLFAETKAGKTDESSYGDADLFV